ncbi:hypothetical protein PTSG_03808 [Salpingoeca rosetta]|uniref:Lipocalin/cytosolic fatty-acid binding domain-containing protein n=1 Tax=Salpingoeca rosetta (strain ATCC 50818 / BSB-021) TaxID=946362 RepID=F2U5G1_SALR5|nr:uncharacterized protein PTSG_03808 [Salpingoeca rosetta]EGD83177.1 hypothetical protein PTSG_03808 [Salpingoeca rosetta]|eukprot:XP_004995541.1 hypothetical protein PTSG_03808 [Salpingoeca rosetta]
MTTSSLTLALVAAVVVLGTSMHATEAIDVVPNLNVTAYLGRWYQIADDFSSAATFEKGAWCVAADYGLRSDGKISVFNQQRTGSATGPPGNIKGYAYAPNPSIPAKLKVHFDVAPIDGPYWIVAVGPRVPTGNAICDPCYDYAIVTDEAKISLFVLTRDVNRYYAKYNETVTNFLDTNGFNKPWNRPIYTNQPPQCTYSPPPPPSFEA